MMALSRAPLAQLDRVSGYGPEGRGFESLKACQMQRSPTARWGTFAFGILIKGFEGERCQKTCRGHVFPATSPAPQGGRIPQGVKDPLRSMIAGGAVPGRNCRLLPAWAANETPARLLNARAPPCIHILTSDPVRRGGYQPPAVRSLPGINIPVGAIRESPLQGKMSVPCHFEPVLKLVRNLFRVDKIPHRCAHR